MQADVELNSNVTITTEIKKLDVFRKALNKQLIHRL